MKRVLLALAAFAVGRASVVPRVPVAKPPGEDPAKVGPQVAIRMMMLPVYRDETHFAPYVDVQFLN